MQSIAPSIQNSKSIFIFFPQREKVLDLLRSFRSDSNFEAMEDLIVFEVELSSSWMKRGKEFYFKRRVVNERETQNCEKNLAVVHRHGSISSINIISRSLIIWISWATLFFFSISCTRCCSVMDKLFSRLWILSSACCDRLSIFLFHFQKIVSFSPKALP